MSTPGISIADAARSLGVSSRTVRRLIKSGKLPAELIPGPFGDEYRISELPAYYAKHKPMDSTPVQTHTQTPIQTTGQIPSQLIDLIKELQDKNVTLAAQLGAALERNRALENQIKLLSSAKQPWWKRLFARNQ